MPLMPSDRRVNSKVVNRRRLRLAVASLNSHLYEGYMRIATRPHLAVGLTVIAAFAIAVGYTIQVGFPLPYGNDEFSYILAGETFASGRVAFPPASSPAHFEAIHVLQQSTYVSKYPPAQGLALAVGILLADSPRLGVWISFALFGGALVWMLQAWAPPAWSLIATWWTILLVGSTHWTFGYWGGAVAALGGALVFGALGRLGRARPRDALVMGFGVLILANSRPFEGLLVCIPAAAYLLWWLVAERAHTLRRRLTHVVLPVAVLLVVGGIGMLAYNQATTGNPLHAPYGEYEDKKGGAPIFTWGDIAPLHANARVIDIHRWNEDVARFERLQTVKGYRAVMWYRLKRTLDTFAPLLLSFPLLLLPWVTRGARTRAATASLMLVVVGSAVSSWHHPHYVAPALAVLLILYVRCLRTLRVTLARRWPWGRIATGAIVAALFVTGAKRFTEVPREARALASPNHWSRQRAGIEKSLEKREGRHVIFVRYLPQYASHTEWVYNAADRDNAPVVWANDLGDSANVGLLRSMGDRKGWLLILAHRTGPQALQSYAPTDSLQLTQQPDAGTPQRR